VANYAVNLHRTASTTASVGSVAANATRPRRGEFYDILFGTDGTVGENPFLYVIQRFTAAGTSTAVTPQPCDPADAATESTAGQNHTVEPTYTAGQILFEWAINQRASARWFATEHGRLIYPATASNGLGIATPTAPAVLVTTHLWYTER